MTFLSQSNSERIRQLNDSFGRTFTGGIVVITGTGPFPSHDKANGPF
jgi:hypothetical protein